MEEEKAENRVLKKYTGSDTEVKIPDGVNEIGDLAFSGREDITSVSIPESVTRIGEYAFNGCTGLTSITVPGSVKKIGYGAFNGCSGLMIVTVPDNLDVGNAGFTDEQMRYIESHRNHPIRQNNVPAHSPQAANAGNNSGSQGQISTNNIYASAQNNLIAQTNILSVKKSISTAHSLGVAALVGLIFAGIITLICGLIGLSKSNSAIDQAKLLGDRSLVEQAESAKSLNKTALILYVIEVILILIIIAAVYNS